MAVQYPITETESANPVFDATDQQQILVANYDKIESKVARIRLASLFYDLYLLPSVKEKVVTTPRGICDLMNNFRKTHKLNGIDFTIDHVWLIAFQMSKQNGKDQSCHALTLNWINQLSNSEE